MCVCVCGCDWGGGTQVLQHIRGALRPLRHDELRSFALLLQQPGCSAHRTDRTVLLSPIITWRWQTHNGAHHNNNNNTHNYRPKQSRGTCELFDPGTSRYVRGFSHRLNALDDAVRRWMCVRRCRCCFLRGAETPLSEAKMLVWGFFLFFIFFTLCLGVCVCVFYVAGSRWISMQG